LAFAVLMRSGIHPPEIRAVNLDVDWIYRRLIPKLYRPIAALIGLIWTALSEATLKNLGQFQNLLYRWHSPETGMARVRPTGAMVIWVAILLAVTLIASYF